MAKIEDIVEQEAFGSGMNHTREEFLQITELPLPELFKKLTDGWTLLDPSDEVRPVWMCYQQKNYTEVERVNVFVKALVKHMPVYAANELDGKLEHVVVYCSADDYPDTEFTYMSSNNRLQSYVNTALNAYLNRHDKLPKTVYIGAPVEHLSVVSLDDFEKEIRGFMKFEEK